MATILHNKIYQGSTAIKDAYVGSTSVKNAYVGSTLVYDTLSSTQYDTPSISLSYSTTPVVAKGGTLTPTFSYSQAWRYVGYSGTTYEQSKKTSGATVKYTISGSGASINETSGVVTWANRTTTIGNLRSATVTVTVTLNGKTNTKTFTVYLAGNYVTGISSSGHSVSYTAITAGATSSAAPTVNTGTVTYTFSSTSTSTTTPSSTYGSYSVSKSFSIANKTTNGFTNINTSTGVLTATSRGTTYGASSRASATVTCTIVHTWTPTSSYNSAETKTATVSPTTTCSQAANIITKLDLTNAAGGSITTPGTVAASGNSSLSLSSASAASAGVKMTFSSGSTSTSYSDYVTLSISYTWSGTHSMVTYTNGSAASQTVKINSRGTSYSNSTRSCELTRTATFTATLKSGYTNATKVTTTATAKVTITQAKNVITSVSVTTGAGTITHSAGTVSAAGGTVSVTNSASGSYSGTMTFSSGSTAATSDTYGSWSASYSWSESDSNSMISWTAANSTTMSVTVASRSTTFSTSTRSATLTRKYTTTFTLNTTYDDGATSGTNNASTSVTITQAANKITEISSVTVSAGAIGYNSGSTVAAKGLTATTTSTAASASAKVKLASGSTIDATTTHGSWTGPTYSWSETDSAGMISFTSSNATTISVTTASRGSTQGDARSATLKRTASYTFKVAAGNSNSGSALSKDNSATASTTIKQEANAITNTSYGSWSYNWTTTGNSTRTRTVTYTWTSTSTSAGSNQTETGGSRYIVLDSFSDSVAENGTHNFGAGGGTITARTVSHDYWPDTSGSHILTVVITGVTTTCTGFTCTTSGSTVTIKADSKGTTISDANSATLVSTKSGFNKRSLGTCKQAANARSLVSVYLSPYQPDSSWIVTVSSGAWNTCPKTGGYVKSRGYANYTHTSGSALNDLKVTDDASLTWSTGKDSWITNHSNGGYYIHNNTTSSARSSDATWSYTYGGVTKTSAKKTLSQAAGTVEYIITPSVTATGALAAAGASKTSVITYTTKWNGVTTATGTALSGYSITENSDTLNIVTATGTTGTVTIKSSNNQFTSSGTFKYTISKSGYTSATITGSISAGAKTIASYNKPVLTFSYSDINAATTSITPTKTWTQTANYVWNGVSGASAGSALVASGTITSFAECNSSGTTGDYLGNMTIDTSTGVATWSKNTSTSARTGYVKATVSSNGVSESKVASSKQNGDYITSCGTPSITLAYNTNAEPTANATQSPTVSGSVTNTWLAAGNKAGNYSITYKILSGSGATVNASTGVVTWSAANTGTSTKSVTIRATITSGDGCSKTEYVDKTATLKADYTTSSYYTYSNITITNHGSASDIPASGGSRSGSGGTGTQTKTLLYKWKSGKADTSSTTSNCTVTCGSYTSISADSLKTTEKTRTKIGNSTATLTGEGSKTATVSVDVYQEANVKSVKSYGSWKTVSNWGNWTDYDLYYADTTGDYWASCSIGSGITAAGGSATVTKSAGHTVYKWKRQRRSGTQYRDVNYSYTSGSESTETNKSSQTAYEYQKVANGTSAASDSCTIAITSDNNSRFSLSGTTLSHSTMGTNSTTDTCTVRCTNSASTSVVKDASISVTNTRTYGKPVITASYSKQSIYGSSYANNTNRAKLTASVKVTDSWTSGSTAAGSASIISYTKISGASDATVESNGNVAFVNSGGGTDVQSDRSCVVRIVARNNNSTSVTASIDVTAYLQVDSKAVACNWNSFSASYSLASSAANSSTSPTISMNCTVVTRWGFAGTTISQTTVTSPAKITAYTSSYTSGTTFAYGNVGTSTGKVTWTSENTGAYPRTTPVYLRVYATTNTSATNSYKEILVTVGLNSKAYWVKITTSQAASISGGVGTAGLFSAIPSGVSVSSTCMTSPTVRVSGGLPSSVGTSPSLNTSCKSIASGSVFTTSGYANSATGGVGACPSYNSAGSIMNPSASNPNHPVSMMNSASGGTSGTAPVTVYRDSDVSAYIGIRYASGTGLAWIPCKVRLVQN